MIASWISLWLLALALACTSWWLRHWLYDGRDSRWTPSSGCGGSGVVGSPREVWATVVDVNKDGCRVRIWAVKDCQ